MNCSDSIGQLATALAKAQAKVHGASKDKTNPHLKSKYADLASIWDAARDALTANDLSIVQLPTSERSPEGALRLFIETVLMHKSGEWIGERYEMPLVKTDPQGVGSAITYARRYALAAMTSVCPEDDDAESQTSRQSTPEAPRRTTPPAQAPVTDGKARTDKMRIRFTEVCEEIARRTDDRLEGVKGNALAAVKLWFGVTQVSQLTDDQFEEYLARLVAESEVPA